MHEIAYCMDLLHNTTKLLLFGRPLVGLADYFVRVYGFAWVGHSVGLQKLTLTLCRGKRRPISPNCYHTFGLYNGFKTTGSARLTALAN